MQIIQPDSVKLFISSTHTFNNNRSQNKGMVEFFIIAKKKTSVNRGFFGFKISAYFMIIFFVSVLKSVLTFKRYRPELKLRFSFSEVMMPCFMVLPVIS